MNRNSELSEFIMKRLPHCIEAKILSLPFDQGKVIYVKIQAPTWDRPLIVTTPPDEFIDDQALATTIESLAETIRFWERIGPPQDVKITETTYEAYFTPEQEKKIAREYQSHI